jgi:hypothetical protein
MRALLTVGLAVCLSTAATAQAVPKPFPKPGQNPPPVAQPPSAPVAPAQQTPVAPAPVQDPGVPSEAVLGVTVYPTAQFIGSYDAGRGQRYYLFGTTATFAEIVQYYRTLLRQRGELVFEQPQIHQFDLGRFREETMAFPPSVTVKDYTGQGKGGYLVARPGGQSQRYPTIIQIVPNPPVVAR